MERKAIVSLYGFLVIDIAVMTYLNFADGHLLDHMQSLRAGTLRSAARQALSSNEMIGIVASFASSFALFLVLWLNRHGEVRYWGDGRSDAPKT